jgi:hypothetical protein
VEVALLILFDAVAWLKDAGYAGVVGGRQNIQRVEIVLERSDGYREDQVAIAANRFPKKLRAGFVFSPNGTASAVARYSLRGLSRAGTSFPNPLCFSVPASMRQHGDSIPNHIILGKAFLRIRIPPDEFAFWI